MAARFATQVSLAEKDYTNSFTDVSKTAWSYDSIMTTVSLGWCSGFPDGTFGPESCITRAQAIAIVNRMLGRSADESYVDTAVDLERFFDLKKSHWAYYDIMEAANAHDYKRRGNVEVWSKPTQSILHG